MNQRLVNMAGSWTLALLLVGGIAACEKDDPVDPGPDPDPEQMTFTPGARYTYTSYSTDAETGEKIEATERERSMTLVATNLSVHGRGGVALYLDSVIGAGGVLEVLDSLHLQQESGTNNVFRYTAIAQELNLGAIGELDLGRSWQHEARLNATSANWFAASVADTIPYEVPSFPLENEGLEVLLTDSAVASSREQMTIDGRTVDVTKTTHSLRISFNYLVVLPFAGTTPFTITSVTLQRTIWISPELGTIVREEREGKVVEATAPVQGNDVDLSVPIPGYVFFMTEIE